jgi:hypothetical protein
MRLEVTGSRAAIFSIFLRIPQWASGATVTVSGKAGEVPVKGRDLRRTSKRMEKRRPRRARLAFADACPGGRPAASQRGGSDSRALGLDGAHEPAPPLTNAIPPITRAGLLAAKQSSGCLQVWTVPTDSGELWFMPFMEIHDEQYTTYVSVT